MTRSASTTAGSVVAIAIAVGAGLVLPSPAFAQSVADRTLSDVRAESTGGCTTLTVTFNIRVQMLSSFPAQGRELHIRVRPLDKLNANKLSESLRTPQSVPELRSIEYEGDNSAGPTLSLFFTRDMAFTVSAGQQPQTLIIRISEPGAQACASADQGEPGGVPGQSAIPPGLYVINLRSTPDDADSVTAEQQQALAGQVVYRSQFERDSQHWYRLRAGFYNSRQEADAARAALAGVFPDAWVVKVTPDERGQAIANRLTAAAPEAPPPATQTAAGPPGSEADAAESQRLIGEAEQAIQDNDLDRAVQLLTNAVQRSENANTPRALELLGLTRERKGQAAHARAEYEEYLRRYPQGEGADRVRQRLAALGSGGQGGQVTTQLRQAGSLGSAGQWKWGLRGSFSQFYFRDQGRTSTFNTSSTLGTEVDNSVNVNQLLTSGDLTISGGNDRRQFQVRAAGSFTQNFGTSASITTINNGNEVLTFRSRPGGTIGAVTALYFDYTDNDLNSQIRLGRQSRNSAGVLGRFDGGLVGWQINPKLRVNAVAGFPVLSSRQTHVLTERPFYGVSVDLGSKRSPVQTTLYWFDQHSKGGFIDRRSVGVEARFLKPRFNAYGMLDYDVKFGQLNLGLLSLTYNFPDGSNFSLTGDYRRSPLLTTTNALIGTRVAQLDPLTGIPVYTLDINSNPVQTFINPTSLDGLRPFFTDSQIYQLAQDRTLISKTFTVTYSRPITKKLQVNADFSLTDTGGTPGLAERPYLDSAGNPSVPPLVLYNAIDPLKPTGKEYFYGLQLIGSDMLMSNDIYVLSGRLADTATARVYTADFNARLPITSNFRLSPRLRYGYRDGKVTTENAHPGTYSQFQPTLRFNYYPIKHSEIEVEFGGNFSKQTVWNGTSFDRVSETGWVLSAGYRLDF